MDIHEYQAKKILLDQGLPVPDFAVASSLEEVKKILEEKKWTQAALKIQVHAGGRKKAGGVQLATSLPEILKKSKELIGMKVINNQTGKGGVIAKKILLTPLISIKKEYYLAFLIDRDLAKNVLLISKEGGVDIEEVARISPEKILRCPMSLEGDFFEFKLDQIVQFMELEKETALQLKALISSLAKIFVNKEATLLEINPLVLAKENEWVILDVKLSIDDNALFRQPFLASLFDPSQLTPSEVLAREFDLSYVAMEGTVGCMVNGAGLAMATMDLLHYFGGSPANFLDVGGGASEDKIAEGFKMILEDPKVKAIFVNIFGGIMNCATLALGIVKAALQEKICVPLIVRMEGTNVEEGRQILDQAGLNIISIADLEQAAKYAVEAAGGYGNTC